MIYIQWINDIESKKGDRQLNRHKEKIINILKEPDDNINIKMAIKIAEYKKKHLEIKDDSQLDQNPHKKAIDKIKLWGKKTLEKSKIEIVRNTCYVFYKNMYHDMIK